MVSHNGKMPEADVVYSDVKFKKSKGNATGPASLPAESTYSEVKISKTEPSTVLPGSQQQALSNGRSKVTAERVAIAVLTVFLAGAVIFLALTSYKYVQAMKQVQQLTAANKNLTERRCEVNQWKVVEICTKPPPEPCLKCQEGWERLGSQCYYFSSDSSPWEEARNKCKDEGGDLAQIDSRGEQAFLVRILSKEMKEPEDKFWIGLTDIEEEGKMLWVDGSPLNTSLTFWSGRQPDNWEVEDKDGEDCVRMGERGRTDYLSCWFDKTCKLPHRWICERSAENGDLQCF